QQDAVRAHAPVAIADARDLRRGERGREIGRVDHDVVVAEPVALREGNHAGEDPPRGAASQSRTRAGSPRTSHGSRWRHFRANRANAAGSGPMSSDAATGAPPPVRVPPPRWRNVASTTAQRQPASRTAKERSRS